MLSQAVLEYCLNFKGVTISKYYGTMCTCLKVNEMKRLFIWKTCITFNNTYSTRSIEYSNPDLLTLIERFINDTTNSI